MNIPIVSHLYPYFLVRSAVQKSIKVSPCSANINDVAATHEQETTQFFNWQFWIIDILAAYTVECVDFFMLYGVVNVFHNVLNQHNNISRREYSYLL